MIIMNWFDIFIVGMMKGGIIILYEFLVYYFLIYFGCEKEIYYFLLYEFKGLDWYYGQFEGLFVGQYYMDVSLIYFDMINVLVILNKINVYNFDVCVIMLLCYLIQCVVLYFNYLKKVNQINVFDNVIVDEFLLCSIDLVMVGISVVDIFLQYVLDFSCYYCKVLYYKCIFGDRFMVIDNVSLLCDLQQIMQCVFCYVGVDLISSLVFGECKYSYMFKDEVQILVQIYVWLMVLFQLNYWVFCKLVGVDFEW